MARNSTGATVNQDVQFGSGAWLANQTAFSMILWFKSPSNAAGSNFANLWDNSGSFPALAGLIMKTNGTLVYQIRDDANTALIQITSAATDDGNWHWIFCVKRSATDHQFYLDGTSVGTSALTVGALTPTQMYLHSPSATNLMPNGAKIARFMGWRRALTLADATMAAYSGMNSIAGATGVVAAELYGVSPETDESGAGNNTTSLGANSTGDGTGGPYGYRNVMLSDRKNVLMVAG